MRKFCIVLVTFLISLNIVSQTNKWDLIKINEVIATQEMLNYKVAKNYLLLKESPNDSIFSIEYMLSKVKLENNHKLMLENIKNYEVSKLLSKNITYWGELKTKYKVDVHDYDEILTLIGHIDYNLTKIKTILNKNKYENRIIKTIGIPREFTQKLCFYKILHKYTHNKGEYNVTYKNFSDNLISLTIEIMEINSEYDYVETNLLTYILMDAERIRFDMDNREFNQHVNLIESNYSQLNYVIKKYIYENYK